MARRPSFPTRWAALPSAVEDLRARYTTPGAFSFFDDEDEYTVPAIDRNGVAVYSIAGTLSKRGGWFSGAGMEQMAADLRAIAANPAARAIVLAIDSPGGTWDGTGALADAVHEIGASKPVVSFADGCMCSAAYWIGSQAAHVIAAPRSFVGSIGTMMMHADYSAMLEKGGIKITLLKADKSTHKTDGNEYEPLSDEHEAKLVRMLNLMNDDFVEGVNRGRGDRIQSKAETYNGSWWNAEEAPAGLIDQIGTISDAMAKAASLADARAPRLTAPNPLTRPARSMVEVIKSVRAAFTGKPFLSEALGMAADGKTEAEIWQSYASTLEARVTSLEGASAKALADKETAHAAALKAAQDAHATALKAETDRANALDAKLKSSGFSAAENGDGKTATGKSCKVTRMI